MGQILTDEAIILYDPIQTIFDVFSTGGDKTQRQNLISGEYEPDRTLFPVSFTPTLKVTDENLGLKGEERIAYCVTQWYLISASGASTVIDPSDPPDGYEIDTDGYTLIVSKNVPAGTIQRLQVVVTYPNVDTGQLTFNKDIVLSTSALVDFIPSLELNIPLLYTVNPFHIDPASPQQTVQATFRVNTTDMSTDANIVYVWEKMDGSTYRAIRNTDIEVVSIPTRTVNINGVPTTCQYRTMVLDLLCIGKAKYRCTAYHAQYNEAQFITSEVFTFDRKLYGARPQMAITSGKFLKGNVTESVAEAWILVNSNRRDNMLDYYRCMWTFYLLYGSQKQNTTVLGWGDSISFPRSLSGTDRTKKPTVDAEFFELSEYQPVYEDDGTTLVTEDDGTTLVIGQVTNS